MSEHSLAHRTRPHPETAGQLRLGMASEMLPQRPLVHVVLSTNRTRMVGGPPLRYIRISFHLSRIRGRRERRRRRRDAQVHGVTSATTVSGHGVGISGEVGWRVRRTQGEGRHCGVVKFGVSEGVEWEVDRGRKESRNTQVNARSHTFYMLNVDGGLVNYTKDNDDFF